MSWSQDDQCPIIDMLKQFVSWSFKYLDIVQLPLDFKEFFQNSSWHMDCSKCTKNEEDMGF
jgi:hypothetical protein